MAKTYAQMKTNVGNALQDTSAAFAILSGRWLNDKYRDINRRGRFSASIHFDHTFQTVVGTALYSLPADFEQEIFCANVTDGMILTRKTEAEWWSLRATAFQAGALLNGNSDTYVILEGTSQIKLDPPPDRIRTIAFPYKMTLTDLSGDSDTTVIKDIEVIMEYGAIGEGLAYKKQYQKADYYFQRYENELMKRIGQEKAKINQVAQRISSGYRMPKISRFTGDTSYEGL